jgi:hypothetical protein
VTGQRVPDGIAGALLLVAVALAVPAAAAGPSAGPGAVPVPALVTATLGAAAVVLLVLARLPAAVTASRGMAVLLAVLVLAGTGGMVWAGTAELRLQLTFVEPATPGDHLQTYLQPLSGAAVAAAFGLAVVAGLRRGGAAAAAAEGAVVAWGAVIAADLAGRLAAEATREPGTAWTATFLDAYLLLGGPFLPAAAVALARWGAPAGEGAVPARWRGATAGVAAPVALVATSVAGAAVTLAQVRPDTATWARAELGVLVTAVVVLAAAAARPAAAPVLVLAATGLGLSAFALHWYGLLDDVAVPWTWVTSRLTATVAAPLALAAGLRWTARRRARGRILVGTPAGL